MIKLKKCMMRICGFLIILLFSGITTRADEIPSPIAISNFKMNGTSFKEGDTIQYCFDLLDVGIEECLDEGLTGRPAFEYGAPPYYHDSDAVYICWSSSERQSVVQSFKWSEKGKKNKKLRIKGSIPVQKGMQPGKWKMVAIYCQYGNLDFSVVDKELVLRSEEEGEDRYRYTPSMKFSVGEFTVSGTKADNKAPTLDLKSLKLSKKYIKKKGKSTFSLKVRDSSNIEEVVAVWDVYNKYNKSKTGDYFEYYRMEYNKKKKTYQCKVTLDASYERKAQLVGIEVRDIYGNSKLYYSMNVEKDTYDEWGYYYGSIKKKKYYKAYKNMVLSEKR